MSAPLGSCLSPADQAALVRLRRETRVYQVPARRREALRLQWHGLAVAEIARVLEITERQVRVLLEGS